MADQWNVVSQTPTAAPAAPPPSGGGNQWNVVSQTPSPTAASAPASTDDDESYWDAMKRRVGSNPHEFVENIRQRLSDASTGAGRYLDEGLLPIERAIRATPVVGAAAGRAGLDAQMAHDTATVNAPLPTDPERRGNQGLGAEGANLLEWVLGEKWLASLGIVDKLKAVAPIEKMIKSAPKTAEVLMRSIRAGTVSGGQTLLHGGDSSDAIANAALTALGTGAVEGGTTAASHSAETLRQPAPRSIAGEDFPLLASDPQSVKGPGSAQPTAFQTAAAEAGKERGVMAERQAAAQRGLRNIAHDALDSEFNKVTQERTPPTATEDEGRMLPAPEPEPPQPFTIQTAGDHTETSEGTGVYEPRKKQIGHNVVEGKGPGQFDLSSYSPELFDAEAERAAEEGTLGATRPTAPQQGSHREPIFQYLNAVKPGTEDPTSYGLTGGGTVTFSGPEEARAALDRHNDIIDSPEFNKLDPADRKHIKTQRESLQYQLDSYHAGLVDPNAYKANVPHFPVPDLEAAKANTHTLRDAANQIENLHQPVFQALDANTRGEYDTLRKEEMALRKIIQDPSSVKAYNRAIERTGEIRDRYLDFFNDPQVAQRVSPQERQSAIDGYRKAQRLHDLSNFVESAHNVTVPWSKRLGIERLFEPGANFQKGLEKVSDEGGADLESLIGPEGAANIGRMANMVSTPEKQAAYKGLLGNIAGIIKRNYHGIGGGRAIGAGVGAEAVLGTVAPAAAGAAAKFVIPGFLGAAIGEGSARHVMNKLATDSLFNKRFTYAIEHNVPPRISVPLLTMQLQKDLEQKEEDRKEQEQTK
jgi:hypothetical protein